MKNLKLSLVYISAIIVCISFTPCFANQNSFDNYTNKTHYLSYSSASSLKFKINSMNRQIKLNNSKIRTIKNSKKISQSEKRRQIRKLENKNYELERKIKKIKREYAQAIS